MIVVFEPQEVHGETAYSQIHLHSFPAKHAVQGVAKSQGPIVTSVPFMDVAPSCAYLEHQGYHTMVLDCYSYDTKMELGK